MGKISNKIKKISEERTVGLILVSVFVLIFILILAIAFNRASNDRSSNDKPATSEQLFQQESKLVQSAEGSSVKILLENGVTADEKHYSVQMTISANSRDIRVLKGYENIEERSEVLPNNLEAYKAFLNALEKYNFTEEREDTSGFGYREACPTSRLYRFSLTNNLGNTKDGDFDRWYTTCSGARYGEYGGRVSLVYKLFRNQFPDYTTHTRGINLN